MLRWNTWETQMFVLILAFISTWSQCAVLASSCSDLQGAGLAWLLVRWPARDLNSVSHGNSTFQHPKKRVPRLHPRKAEMGCKLKGKVRHRFLFICLVWFFFTREFYSWNDVVKSGWWHFRFFWEFPEWNRIFTLTLMMLLRSFFFFHKVQKHFMGWFLIKLVIILACKGLFYFALLPRAFYYIMIL